MNTQNYSYSQSQYLPQPTSNSVNFNDQPRSSQEQSENHLFFQQNKIIKRDTILEINTLIIQLIIFHLMMKNTIIKLMKNFIQAEDSIDQPDIFEPCPRDGQILQLRNNPRSYNNNFQPQNLVKTQSYQPTKMHNEIPLPYYLPQHEIKKSQLTNFSQMPNAAESLQMTMNPYLMGGSSISSNITLMVFTGTGPKYFVEDNLNAVTAILTLNIGPEPVNTPLHQNWIHRRTALIQTALDGAAQKWFSV